MAINGQLLQQAGQGDAYVLPAFNSDRITERLDHAESMKAAKAAAAAKAKQDRDNRLDELMKWNPEQAWYPHTEQTNNAIKDVYNTMTEIRKSGVEPTPDQLNLLNQKKWNAEVLAKKSQDIKVLYPQLKEEIEKSDKYTDKAYLNSKLNDEIFSEPDVNKIDFNNLGNISSDPKAFKHGDWVADFADSLPEQIESIFGQMSVDGGSVLVDKEVKSKFLDLDSNGNVRYDKNGKPLVKISNETIDLALQDPRYAYHIQEELSKPNAKYKTASEIVKNELSTFAKREEKTNYNKGFDKEKDKDKLIIGQANDVYRNQNSKNKSTGVGKVHEGWVPVEYTLNPEKFKNVPVTSDIVIDPKTNTQKTDNVGVQNYTISKLFQKPVDAKTGEILHGEKEDVLRHKNGVVYKWFAEASREEGKSKKTVTEFIPYEKLESFFVSRGIDVNKMGNDPLGINISTEDPLGLGIK